MKMMRFSLVFLLESHVKDLVRTICDARLICSEIICKDSPWIKGFEEEF